MYLPALSLDLTIEQQCQMRIYEECIPKLSPEQTRELLLEASRQLMAKDNVIRSLLKR